MKKLATLLLAGCILAPGIASAAFVKPDKLFDDYDKYAVVYMDSERRVYVDTDTVVKDYAPAGTLPVLRGKAYTEVYVSPLDYPAYGNKKVVRCIVESELAVGADQFGSDIRYRLLNKNTAAYDENGQPVSYNGADVKDTSDNAKEMYVNLYRLTKDSV